MTTETTTTKKRKRTVFPTQEVIHKWANETQESGRNAQGNCYFEGKSLFSYGLHYEIGRHVTGRKGEKVVFLNDEGSTVTTQKHKSWTRSSVPSDRVSFSVISFENLGVNLLHIISLSKDARDKAKKARQNKVFLLNRSKKLKSTAIEYFHLFADQVGLDTIKIYKAFLKKWDEKQFQLELIDGQAKAEKAEEKRKIANTERDRKRKIANAERDRIRELDRIERAKEDQEKLELWKAGENVQTRFNYQEFAYLRVKGDKVETSQGASISAKSARVFYKMILAGKEIRTYDLEGFKVIGLSNEGQALKVGCHVVEFSEIHRIGEQLETVSEVETVLA